MTVLTSGDRPLRNGVPISSRLLTPHDANLAAVGGDDGLLPDRAPRSQRVEQPLVAACILAIRRDMCAPAIVILLGLARWTATNRESITILHDAVGTGVHPHAVGREEGVPEVVRRDVVPGELGRLGLVDPVGICNTARKL